LFFFYCKDERQNFKQGGERSLGLLIILPCKHRKSNLGDPALGYNQ
jgi:hypothetical protein